MYFSRKTWDLILFLFVIIWFHLKKELPLRILRAMGIEGILHQRTIILKQKGRIFFYFSQFPEKPITFLFVIGAFD